MLACVSRYVIDCVGMYAYTRQYNMHVHIYIYKYMLIYLCNYIQIRTLLKYRVDVQVRQTHVLLHAPIYLLFWIYFMCVCVCTGTFLHWLTGVCIYIYINILHMQDEVMKLSRTYTESKQEAHADIAI